MLSLPLVGIEVVAVEARVAGMLLPMVLMLAPGQAMMPMGITSLRGMALLRCQQHLGGTLWQPLAQGQLRWLWATVRCPDSYAHRVFACAGSIRTMNL